MYDLIIIGSGPAGLSAAVYGRRAGFSTLVIEKNPMSGGQVLNTYEVDNYLGLPGINGFDMGMKFREHAEKMQAEFVEADVTGIRDEGDYKTVQTSEGNYEGKAVIIASGAVHSHLGVPGEEELSGMGVSYCATCDGAFFRGKTVAVVGGGDVAVEDAIFLARACEKVYLIHRRDSLRAARSLQETMLALPNVEVIWDSVVERINGDDMVQSLTLRSRKTDESSELPVQGVFIAVGIRPNSECFVGNIAADEKGYLIAGEGLRNQHARRIRGGGYPNQETPSDCNRSGGRRERGGKRPGISSEIEGSFPLKGPAPEFYILYEKYYKKIPFMNKMHYNRAFF